jgi:hypothetical protein
MLSNNSQMQSSILNSTRAASAAATNAISTFNLVAYLYLMPLIALFGFLANLLCLIVFLKPTFDRNAYKYIYMRTVSHLIFLLLLALSWLVNCSSCSFFSTLLLQVYFIYVYSYVIRVALTLAALAEIAISYERLCLFKRNEKFSKLASKSFVSVTVLFAFTSLILNVPYLFAFRVERVSPGIYIFARTSFGSTSVYRLYIIIFNFMQSFLSFLALIVINTLVAVEFRKHMNKKKNLIARSKSKSEHGPAAISDARSLKNSHGEIDRARTNKSCHLNNQHLVEMVNINATSDNNQNKLSKTEIKTIKSIDVGESNSQKVELNFTVMIIVSSLAFSFTRLVQCINSILLQILPLLGLAQAALANDFLISFFSSLFVNLYFSCNIFVYLLFNKMFRVSFKRLFISKLILKLFSFK